VNVNVLLVQNHRIVRPDMVETAVRKRDVTCTLVRTFLSEPLPDPGDQDAVMVFGSPASCLDIETSADLRRLRDWVSGCVAADRAVLGICFGAQMLAQVLGAAVRRNEVGEFGCTTVSLTDEGGGSGLFRGFPPSFQMAQWHTDTFGLPPGASLLATSQACHHQAFASGRRVGLQFHIEASPRLIADWAEAGPKEPEGVGKSAEQVVAECEAVAAEQARLCDVFVENFLKLAAS
jgi:GMP synthase (glutamine-hydrolysing)